MGALVGAVVGDLLGIPHEFSDPSAIPAGRLMPTGGGPFRFPPGVGSDDTDLLFAAINAYDHNGLFDPNLALDNMLSWFDSEPRDIGTQTLSALTHWSDDLEPPPDEAAQGNGGLMRAAAHAIMSKSLYRARTQAEDDTSLTHPSSTAIACSGMLAHMTWKMIHHEGPIDNEALRHTIRSPNALSKFRNKLKPYDRDAATEGGHCVHSLRLGMRVLLTANTFEEGMDRVIRTGGDTDTNGAIAGALLGARFGEKAIPRDWRDAMTPALREAVENVRLKTEVKEAA